MRQVLLPPIVQRPEWQHGLLTGQMKGWRPDAQFGFWAWWQGAPMERRLYEISVIQSQQYGLVVTPHNLRDPRFFNSRGGGFREW